MGYKFLLFGLPQITANFGCEALVQGTGVVLKRTNPDCEAIYISDGHAKTDRECLGPSSPIKVDDSAPRMGARFFARRFIRKINLRVKRQPLTHRLLKEADCVLSIGGDLYTFVDAETKAIWPYPWPIVKDGNLIMDKGLPYVIWCASIGPLEKAGDKLGVLIEHFKRCKAIIVREQTSYSYLTETLSIKDNVYLAADPSYLMEPEPFDAPFLEKSENTTIAVNLSLGPINQVYGTDKSIIDRICEDYLEGMSEIISNLGVRIMLMPHSLYDHSFVAGFYSELNKRHGDKVWQVPRSLGARKSKWAISQCDGLVTILFHCALAGFGTCTPTILVLTKPKGKKLIKDTYGNMNYSLDLREFSKKAFINKVELMLSNLDSMRSGLEIKYKEMEKRALYAGEILKAIL